MFQSRNYWVVPFSQNFKFHWAHGYFLWSLFVEFRGTQLHVIWGLAQGSWWFLIWKLPCFRCFGEIVHNVCAYSYPPTRKAVFANSDFWLVFCCEKHKRHKRHQRSACSPLTLYVQLLANGAIRPKCCAEFGPDFVSLIFLISVHHSWAIWSLWKSNHLCITYVRGNQLNLTPLMKNVLCWSRSRVILHFYILRCKSMRARKAWIARTRTSLRQRPAVSSWMQTLMPARSRSLGTRSVSSRSSSQLFTHISNSLFRLFICNEEHTCLVHAKNAHARAQTHTHTRTHTCAGSCWKYSIFERNWKKRVLFWAHKSN